MSLIIVNRLFGEDTLALLPDQTFSSPDERLAFLLGNQGADPFSLQFTSLPQVARTSHRFAHKMRRLHDGRAVTIAREATGHLIAEDRPLGRAFVLGLLAHTLLEGTTRPFVVAQRNALIAADEELAKNQMEVAAIIESDIDSWMLMALRQQTIEQTPTSEVLYRSEQTVRAAGALFSQIAWQVFSMDLGADAYRGALDDCELLYSVLDQSSPLGSAMLDQAERVFGGLSYLRSLVHRTPQDESCPAANTDHRVWIDPHTEAERTESFYDLYQNALNRWPAVFEAFEAGDDPFA